MDSQRSRMCEGIEGSDTPRTDAVVAKQEKEFSNVATHFLKMTDHAYQLERELAAALAALSESRDTKRLDFLAEITNIATLAEHGRMLPGDEVRKIDVTAKALSTGYEIQRRTHDTPQAFRLAVDQAMTETGHAGER